MFTMKRESSRRERVGNRLFVGEKKHEICIQKVLQ
jgi:hypothetical protein